MMARCVPAEGVGGADVAVRDRAVLLTAPGAAAVAVLRLCGPGITGFLRDHFSGIPVAGKCVHGLLRDGGRVVDDPVVVLDPGGGFADLNLHGGPWVVRSACELAVRRGFGLIPNAAPPLPAEAVDATSAMEAEVLQWLPAARTELGVRVLLDQPARWRDFVRGVGDAGIRRLPSETLCDTRALHWLLHPPRVAVVGVPNVGKSTLANRLFAQERSITADLPGTTRDWVGEIANVDGLAALLVDTPGVRETDDLVERAAIRRSESEVGRADLVVVVLDPTLPFEPEQAALLRQHSGALVVVNKSDRRPGWENLPADAIRTVATAGEGVDELRERIKGRFRCDAAGLAGPLVWTERQREILRRAEKGPEAIRLILDEVLTEPPAI